MTPRPPLDELLSLFRATVAAEGTTTDAGNVAGNTFIDAALAGAGANSFVSMLVILYHGDPQNVDSKDITAFNTANGEVTLAGAYKGVAAAIPAGVPYKIVTFRFVPAEVAALTAALAAHEAAQLVSRGLLVTVAGYLDTEIAAILAAVDTEVAAIETKLDTPANFMADVTALALEATLAVVDGIVDNILLDTQIRTIQSGAQAILAAATEWLHIDSGTNGAEILSIAIAGINGHDWTLAVYVPSADAVAAPAADDRRDVIAYLAADTEGGLLNPFGIPFNAYLQLTNDGANDQIDQVTITYRSRGVLTLTWGP